MRFKTGEPVADGSAIDSTGSVEDHIVRMLLFSTTHDNYEKWPIDADRSILRVSMTLSARGTQGRVVHVDDAGVARVFVAIARGFTDFVIHELEPSWTSERELHVVAVEAFYDLEGVDFSQED